MGMFLRDMAAPDRKKIRAGYRHAGWLPRKMKWKINLAPAGLNWQITLALGVENNFGPTPAKVENYHGPRQLDLTSYIVVPFQ
jgi:hypothetical protein